MGFPVHIKGHEYRPINLKRLMVEHGITHESLAKEVKQARGIPLSRSALNFIINHSYFPKNTPEQEIKGQILVALKARGVDDESLAAAFSVDDFPADYHMQPAGVHLGAGERRNRKAIALLNDIEPLEVEVLSLAAKRHFKLFRDPFQDDVNGPDDVFLADDQRYIREAMFQTAKHGGFLAVAGESGAGKSVLRRDMIDRINRDGAPIVVIFPRTIDKTRLTAGAICEAIMEDLSPGLKVRSGLEAKARQVERLLRNSSQAGNSHVLLIEEAHDLSVQTLKYLKRFWELEDGYKRLLAIILVGQPELRERLDERRNPDAREVIRRCEIAELLPLDSVLPDYLAHKFRRAGIDVAQVFAEDAYDGVRLRLTRTKPGSREVLSQIYPLVVNNLATKAMNRAAELGLPLVTGDLIKEL